MKLYRTPTGEPARYVEPGRLAAGADEDELVEQIRPPRRDFGHVRAAQPGRQDVGRLSDDLAEEVEEQLRVEVGGVLHPRRGAFAEAEEVEGVDRVVAGRPGGVGWEIPTGGARGDQFGGRQR